MNHEQLFECLNHLRAQALRLPCRNKDNIMDHRRRLDFPGMVVSIGIYRRPDLFDSEVAWHSAVCLRGGIEQLKRASCASPAQKKRLKSMALEAISCVGVGAVIETVSEYAYHASRQLSAEELVAIKELHPALVLPVLS